MVRGHRPSLIAWLVGANLYVCADGSMVHAPVHDADDQPRPAPQPSKRAMGRGRPGQQPRA